MTREDGKAGRSGKQYRLRRLWGWVRSVWRASRGSARSAGETANLRRYMPSVCYYED